MSCTASQIIAFERGEIGVKEYPAGWNKVKYNTEYYGREVYDPTGQGYSWCCTFQWYGFRHVGASDLFYGGGKTASCTDMMNYAKKNGLWVTSGFKPGDLLLYNWKGITSYANHIGLCTENHGSYVKAIEGNTSLTDNDNGGCVMERSRPLSFIIGAYRPRYLPEAAAATGGCTVTVTTKEISYGSTGAPVRSAQILLNGYGYSCGTVDGDFGSKTKAATIAYQKAKGLTADGIIGAKTWSRLING